ncbi:S8 family serine peptidase [Shewanella maritima]|uniref:S8 family serine peptidase n=1 Tax=Shewanella maritima TaxID=2520507 RepID=UPI003736DBBA
MKLNKISLMTMAALYAAGAGAAASSGSGTLEGARSIEITDAIIKYNEQLNSGKDRAGRSINGSTVQGKNNHRAITTNTNYKVPFQHQQGLQGEQTYIIELNDKPVSLYTGGIQDLAATSPKLSTVPTMLNPRGYNKLDVNSQAVRQYTNYLAEKQNQALADISSVAGSSAQVTEQYALAFNGMAMRMTQDQAARVSELPGIRNVTLEKNYELHSDTGPIHIGADGLWSGTQASDNFKGEGIVVGVLDTGINSDHPSFAAVAGDGYEHTMPARYDGYIGDCEMEEFADMCNDKLIGIRSYAAITDSYKDWAFNKGQPYGEPLRPQNGEDYNGHGSHTASTAAGNELFDVPYVVAEVAETSDGIATDLVFPKISGVAPRANIISYQVCFPGDGSLSADFAGCPGSALLAGIEDAIADGVDVINYSIGTTFGSFPWDDPMELGFLAAREAGISVAASAGNAYDPNYASQARGAIDHLSPWLTSVAATTHGRTIEVEGKMLTNSSGGDQPLPELQGGGITGEYTGPVVSAASYGYEYEMCNDPFPADFFSVDPNGIPFDVAPIVVCKRGDIPRVEKATNIEAGGAGALILWNPGYSDPAVNDPYSIPGINITYSSFWGGAENNWYGLNQWLSSGSDHRATITASTVVANQGTADYVADFSSRGPNLEVPDVMTPSLAAPGVDVYAAYADDMPFNAIGTPADYAAISGTSMASPHVAGAMALLSQSHPDWTPAQIQSALMTTASLDGVTRNRDDYPWDAVAAGFSDAGSGVINVSRANNAGLLLDETADNYRAANPKNGGNIHTLNLPYFYNDSCKTSCTWMRTVTATQDGTWTVDATPQEMDGAQMLTLEAHPKTFTLKAGETQAIMLSATILDVEAIGADSSQIQLMGSVTLSPEDTSMPSQHMPVAVRYTADKLPVSVAGQIHRETGHTLTPMLETEEIQSLNPSVYGLTKAQQFTFNLKRANQDKRLYSEGYTVEEIEADGGAKVTFFDVPEGTKRLVWEVLSVDKQAYSAIDLGMDVNEDGEVQWLDEAICFSFTDSGDYCAINNPTPGKYWAIAANWKWEYEDPSNAADEFVLSLAMVGDTDSANLTVEGPASTNGTEPYQLQLNYDLPGAVEGDVYYGVVGLGTDDYNQGNLGEFAVKLQHLGSDTHISASQTAAKAGDIVDFSIELAPNLLGGERDFTFKTMIPEHLQLLEDSISVGGVGNYSDNLMVEGNTINISATQPSSADTKRHYVFTTSLEDEMCKLPYGDGTYVDLPSHGYAPMGMSGYSNQVLRIPLSSNGLPHAPLYGNPEMYGQDTLAISPFGYVQFDPLNEFWNNHIPFNEVFQNFPDTMVAPLWRGDVMMPETSFDWSSAQYVDDVYAIVTGDHYVFQWVGGEEWFNFFVGNTNPDLSSNFNLQTVIATDISFEANTPEVMFAYKELTTSNPHFGTIGLHGYWGERGTFGPANGWYNDGFAYNDVDQKIAEGMVICADYRGPEQTAVTLNFSARVSGHAIGSDNTITVETQYADSELVTETYTVATNSNISVIDIADMTIEENTTSSAITVTYHDVKGTTNGIQVSGENITATVEGDSFTITPDADWHGMTEVTVTVHDMAYPSDQASTSFMLTVNSDGVEPVVPATPDPEPEPESDSSGGSLGFLALTLLGLLAGGRRKLTK